MEKIYWTNKKGEKVDIDEIEDVKYLRNLVKFLIRQRDNYEYMDIGDYQDTF